MEHKIARAWYVLLGLMIHCGMRGADADYKQMVADPQEKQVFDKTYARKYMRTYTPLGCPLTLCDDHHDERSGKRVELDVQSVRSVALTAKRSLLAYVAKEGCHQLISADENFCVKKRDIPSTSEVFMALSWYENVLAVGRKRIHYWNVPNDYMRTYSLKNCYPVAAAVHPNQEHAVVASISTSGNQFHFFFHDGMSVKESLLSENEATPASSSVISLAWHPTKCLFASGLRDGVVRIWGMPVGRQGFAPMLDIEAPKKSTGPRSNNNITALLYTPLHIIGALVCKNDAARNNIIRWNVSSRQIVRNYSKPHGASITNLCTIDDNCFASSSLDGTVKVWDVRQPEYRDMIKHGDPVEALRVCEEHTLVSCSKSAEVEYWDLRRK